MSLNASVSIDQHRAFHLASMADSELYHQSHAGPDTSQPRYPGGVPDKLDADGHVQPFPGNTIICHLSASSDLYVSMLELYKKMEESPLSHLFALLPPSSWHMTVFEGICDKVRQPAYWPSDLPLDTPLVDCNAVFANRLATFNLKCDPPYRMKITGFDPLEIGIAIHVEPGTADESTRLLGLRDRLSDCLKIRHPVHDTYGFHLSMAYLLRFPSDDQKMDLSALLMDHFKGMPKAFDLNAPEFCTFEDMFAFKQLFYLKN
jgi:hypothetical protein